MFKMSRAPGIHIYCVTALPTERGLEWDDLLGPSNTCHAKVLLFLSTCSNTESCLLRYSLITSFSPRAHLPCTNISHLSLAPRTPRGPVLETFHVLSHQVPCPILLWAHILPSLTFVAYIFQQALLVCDMPGHIQLQLISYIPNDISIADR